MSQMIYEDAHRKDEVLLDMLRRLNIEQLQSEGAPATSTVPASSAPREINLPRTIPSERSRASLAYPHSPTTWTEYSQPQEMFASTAPVSSTPRETNTPNTIPAERSRASLAYPQSLTTWNEYGQPRLDPTACPGTVAPLLRPPSSASPAPSPSHTTSLSGADPSRVSLETAMPLPTSTATQVYNIASGLETGITTEWSRAAHATQGIPGGHVKKIAALSTKKITRRGNATRYPFYVVFEGLVPGIYTDWEECSRQVTGVSCNVHNGFYSRRDAERAYILAYAIGGVRAIPRKRGQGQPRIPAAPMPETIMDAFAAAPEDFLGAEWHVVYKGKRPGIYPAWNFAASQVLNVGCAAFERFYTKQEAVDAFDDAVANGRVQTL